MRSILLPSNQVFTSFTSFLGMQWDPNTGKWFFNPLLFVCLLCGFGVFLVIFRTREIVSCNGNTFLFFYYYLEVLLGPIFNV